MLFLQSPRLEADKKKCTSIFLRLSKVGGRFLLNLRKIQSPTLAKNMVKCHSNQVGNDGHAPDERFEKRTFERHMLVNVFVFSLTTTGELIFIKDSTTKNENCTSFI